MFIIDGFIEQIIHLLCLFVSSSVSFPLQGQSDHHHHAQLVTHRCLIVAKDIKCSIGRPTATPNLQ